MSDKRAWKDEHGNNQIKKRRIHERGGPDKQAKEAVKLFKAFPVNGFDIVLSSAFLGKDVTVRALIRAGAPAHPDPDRQANFHDYPPLFAAAKNGHLEVIKVLVTDGQVPIYGPGNKLRLAAMDQAGQAGHVHIVMWLGAQEGRQAPAQASDNASIDKFWVAASTGDLQQLQAMLSGKDNLQYLITPDVIAGAVKSGQVGIVRYLLQHGGYHLAGVSSSWRNNALTWEEQSGLEQTVLRAAQQQSWNMLDLVLGALSTKNSTGVWQPTSLHPKMAARVEELVTKSIDAENADAFERLFDIFYKQLGKGTAWGGGEKRADVLRKVIMAAGAAGKFFHFRMLRDEYSADFSEFEGRYGASIADIMRFHGEGW